MPKVLVTGANRGIGLEFAAQYAADGWDVIACCRRPDEAPELAALYHHSASKVEVHALDLNDFSSIDRLAQSLRGVPVDVLINNAGVYPKAEAGELGNIDYGAWEAALRINTLAPLKMAEAFLENVALSEKKCIATLTSKMGSISDNSSGGSYPYRSSKAAVNMVMSSLATDLKGRGITVLLLHPGWVQTAMGGRNALITPQASVAGLRKVIAQSSLRESGTFRAYDGAQIGW